ISNTLANENPNKKAGEFVNSFKRRNSENATLLEVIWLTTNRVADDVSEAAQAELKKLRAKNGWAIRVDFVPFDKTALRRMISDAAYGYIPYTGKKTLPISGR